MTEKKDNALQPYQPRALERKVKRHVAHMEAKHEVANAVVDNGTELHNYASTKMVEAAQFDHLMLQAAAQNLNGSYAALEEDLRRLGANHRAYLLECTHQNMVSFLRQAENMPVDPEVGWVERLGDGIAGARDEYHRLRGGA